MAPARSVGTWLERSAAGRVLLVMLALACLSLTAIHPLLFGTLPVSNEGPVHLYRLVALDHAVRNGDVWPRYLPGMLYGYGSPLFNFTSPLPLYPLEGLHLLGVPFLTALLAGFIAYLLLAMLGAYALGSTQGGPLTGLGAAAAYLYAPYLLFESIRHGDLAQVAGLALLPWALWGLWRLARQGRRGDFVAAVLLCALLILMHNVAALIGIALLALCAAYLWWTSSDPPRAFARLALALVAAVGLTAFYWLPALGEMRYVHTGTVAGYTPVQDFRDHFLPLTDILALPATADLTQLQPPIPRTLGWPQVALAAAGLILALLPDRRRDERSAPRARVKPGSCFFVPSRVSAGFHLRFSGSLSKREPENTQIALLLSLAAGLVFLVTPAAAPVWAALRPLWFVQHPWRLLGPASLMLAAAAGHGIALAAQRIRGAALRAAWAGLCVAVMIAGNLPLLYSLYLPDQQARSIVDVIHFESSAEKLAGTGEIVARWTDELPDPRRLIGLYMQGEIIPRLQPNPDVRLGESEWQNTHASLRFTAVAGTRLVFDWLYFPGWWALLDGQAAPVIPTGPQGFVGVEAEAGEHTLELGFGPTPLRQATVYTSLGMLALLIAALALRIWRRRAPSTREAWRLAGPVFAAAAVAGLLAFGSKALFIDTLPTPFRRERFADGIEAGLQTPVNAVFGGQITLLGYDLPRRLAAPGQSIPLTLYWTPSGGMIDGDYASLIIIRDSAGSIIAYSLSSHPAGVPTYTWVPGFYVRERIDLAIPPGTPPGSYTLHAALIASGTGQSLDVTDSTSDTEGGVMADLAALDVIAPLRPARLDALPIDAPLNAGVTDALMLVHASAPPAQAEVGQAFTAVWYWQAREDPDMGERGAGLSARLEWLSEDGQVAAHSRAVPLVAGFPSSQWQRRDVWRGVHGLFVPGSLEAGHFEVVVQVIDAAGKPAGEPVAIGEMDVTTPPRTFDLPEMGVAADVDWANGIRLLGYDLLADEFVVGDGLSLTFYWQGVGEVQDSLSAFLEIADREGRIVLSRTQIPAGGARPTTGWAPGEVIADGYGILLEPGLIPPGEYRVRVGWRQAATGEAVRAADGGVFWLLPHVITISAAP
jgi:hypothetical protein